ncbi:hypothetical protein [Solemya velesiana gill symbiont]|uniref:Uncharacterized protein n=1 Tax=Solemya velesiana gill symbiont TaxID=1918948 RepID=A0A1T2KT56_9GAMM|nr:hypothetical protein [Solemya velesiana gill symbiont]OOZ36037.1 hypothetical protein BOW51_09120 [Solemya velesiana gill symbiont]
MKIEISEEEAKRAKIPHEIFLTNLIGNHILWFVAALGTVGTFWQPLAMVPVVSFTLLAYTLWKANKIKADESGSWFVMCHWQIAARRSRIFIYMLMASLTVSLLGWLGYTYGGMMKEAVYAIVGGMGILPVMVTVLVLIIMESDVLHQATHHKLPDRMIELYPNPDAKVVDESPVTESAQ